MTQTIYVNVYLWAATNIYFLIFTPKKTKCDLKFTSAYFASFILFLYVTETFRTKYAATSAEDKRAHGTNKVLHSITRG